MEEIERRQNLQTKLKKITETPDWLSDPVTRLVVNQIRAELSPHAFKDTEGQISLGLLETIDPPAKKSNKKK